MKSDTNKIRLQKYIADCGITSRRKAETLISDGEIKVNNQRVTELGTRIDPKLDIVTWRNKVITPPTAMFYLLLNKPAGYLCSRSDPQGRPLVMNLIPPPMNKLVKPVGRLDFNSTGILLLSNDGEFIQLMTHPSSHIVKKYRVKVGGKVSLVKVRQLLSGVQLEDGPAKAVKVWCEQKQVKNDHLLISVVEGRKHLVKRMCKAVGLRVVKLSRIGYGSLSLRGLKPAEYRQLTPSEVEMLKSRAR